MFDQGVYRVRLWVWASLAWNGDGVVGQAWRVLYTNASVRPAMQGGQGSWLVLLPTQPSSLAL